MKTLVSPKRRYVYTTPHYVTSQGTVLQEKVLFNNKPCDRTDRTVRHLLRTFGASVCNIYVM